MLWTRLGTLNATNNFILTTILPGPRRKHHCQLQKRVIFYVDIRTNSNDKTSPQFIQCHVKPGQFYILPKVHKSGNPQGPIVSSDSHPMERLSHFVGYHLQPLINKLPSIIKDANDFLHKLLTIGNLPTNSLVVTLVDSSLYTNIPHKEGNNACEHSLCTSSNKTIPTSTHCDLIPMILTMNNFSSEDNTIFKSTAPPWVLKWLPRMLIFSWVFSKPTIWKMPISFSHLARLYQ